MNGSRSARRGGHRGWRNQGFRRLHSEHLEERRVLAAQTTGLFINDSRAYEGYTLFAPQTSKTTYLINNEGTVINTWQSQYFPGLLGYLLEDGSLLRAGTANQAGNGTINAPGAGGRLELFSWEGDLLWSFNYDSPQHLAHHDIEPLPNGNILVMAWEFISEAQATAAGRDPNLPGPGQLIPDFVVEIQPNLAAGTGATIVWEWHVWDHLVQEQFPARGNYFGPTGVQDHPELIDVNYVSTGIGAGAAVPEDWTHANAVDYNPELDLILLSVREFNEIWIIDHSTTTTQAAGHTGGRFGKGGDLLWRWGNPEAYDRGGPADRKLFWQHDANWIDDGIPGNVDNIILFNNGWGRGPNQNINFSSADEIAPPLVIQTVGGQTTYSFPPLAPGQAHGPAALAWTYEADPQYFAPIISGARRLPNGNTLITFGTIGTILEVTPEGEIVWKYVNPVTGAGPLAKTDPIPLAFPGTPGVIGQVGANFMFRSFRYGPDYPGLAGRDLTPQFRDTIGLFDPAASQWFLNQEIGGSIEKLVVFKTPQAPSNWIPITGDWDGNGTDTVGLYDPNLNRWYLNNELDGSVDTLIVFSTPRVPASWIPITGDWNGDGIDTVGLYDPAAQTWYLNNRIDGSTTDLVTFKTLNAGPRWRPIAGDWDGDGIDTVGLYNPAKNAWHLYAALNGSLSGRIFFRTPAVPAWWIPLAGDWNDDGHDTVGLYDQFTNTWYTNDETDGTIDSVRAFKTPTVPSTWRPIIGNWDGSGIFGGGGGAASSVQLAAVMNAPLVTAEGEDPEPHEEPFIAQNPANAGDVNADGFVSAIDAVLIINLLNQGPEVGPADLAGVFTFVDVSGDAALSSIDAVLVINELNSSSAASASPSPAPAAADDGITANTAALLAASARVEAVPALPLPTFSGSVTSNVSLALPVALAYPVATSSSSSAGTTAVTADGTSDDDDVEDLLAELATDVSTQWLD